MKADEITVINAINEDAEKLHADAKRLRESTERQLERTSFTVSVQYEHGYNKALRDVVDWVDKHSQSMKFFKMYNAKRIRELLVCFRDNADELRKMSDELELEVRENGVFLDKLRNT